MAPSKPSQPFRMIKKRTGGTFTFTPDPLPAYHEDYIGPDLIGTYGCSTGVGFYFKIDKTRCFMAHMHVKVRMASPEDMEEVDDRSVSAAEGAELKTEVLVRLENEAREHGWYPPAFDREVRICCPYAQGDKSKHRYAMDYMVDGIRAFVGRGNLKAEDVEGFVMDHRAGYVVRDGWFEQREGDEVGVEPEGVAKKWFVAKDAKGKRARNWSFEVVREDLLEPLEAKKTVVKKDVGRQD